MRRIASVLLLLAWGSAPALAVACVVSRPQHAAVGTAAVSPADPQAAVAEPPRVGWGVVAYREVGVTGASFTLETARRCDRMPERSARRDVILDTDAERAGCTLRSWHGRVSLSVRDLGGSWTELAPMSTDREGRLRVRFAEVERGLESVGGPSLAEFSALRVGRGGWAGTYDLQRLRDLQADVHATWIPKGWGVPALFTVLHPSHPRARVIADLAVEARLARQEQDFAAIERGELEPAAFLDRHVWSPLRVRVAALLDSHSHVDDGS